MCRSRRELSNAYLLAKFGFDTAENEPCKVCPLSVYRSPRFMGEYDAPSMTKCAHAVNECDHKVVAAICKNTCGHPKGVAPNAYSGAKATMDYNSFEGNFGYFPTRRMLSLDSRRNPRRLDALSEVDLRTPVNNIEYFPPNFEGLVLGCIDADFCK